MPLQDGPEIEFYRGDGHAMSLRFKFNGVPMDITGATVWFTVKKVLENPDENASIQKKIIDHEDQTIDELRGMTAIVLLCDDTKIEVYDGYWYDIQLQMLGGCPLTVRGRLNVKQDVTLVYNEV
ncbi:MAG: hypothetical protein JRJ85_15920 [Deltaproteobacteria bacterium]|nr:hypothetical protein [Deltaproteobacteria bacterium]